jgi:hypothetical protein
MTMLGMSDVADSGVVRSVHIVIAARSRNPGAFERMGQSRNPARRALNVSA